MPAFLRRDLAPGILLTAATLLALGIANSALAPWYRHLLGLRVQLGPDALHLAKPLLLWINDGLMAVFFFLVGLEIKREVLAGELSSVRRLSLPLTAAVGGMFMPAAIYAAINAHDAFALRGWAIPAATDIAFALGVLSLLGSRIPPSLKIFLTAIAILDDLGAILIIAIFYTHSLSIPMLAASALCLGLLGALNFFRISHATPYLLAGAVLWLCVLKSGIHPTLAGVATALAIPLAAGSGGAKVGQKPQTGLVDRLEHALKPWVDFAILPAFAFANAGLSLAGVSLSTLVHPITLGIALGLICGKAAGIFGASWAAVRLGWAELPARVNGRQLFGVACLCGIGFTMSLFIGSLAFGEDGEYPNLVKLGVMSGSLLAAAVGIAVLRKAGLNTANLR